MPRTLYMLACLLLFSSSIAVARNPVPAKVLVTGFPAHIQNVAGWFESDPMMDPRQVPSRTHLTTLQGSDIQRFIRLYFPRTYEDLLEYEYIMLLVIEVSSFTQQQQRMMLDAIRKAGIPAISDRSVMSMAEYIAQEWAASELALAFPNDAPAVVAHRPFSFNNRLFRYVINTHPQIPPIFTPYKDFEGVETTHLIGTTCIMIPKEGAVAATYIIGDLPEGSPGAYPGPDFRAKGMFPHTLYWKYGNATTWTHTDMTGGDLYWNPAHNPYSLDMLMSEFMFAAGWDLPSDVVLLHNLRSRFSTFLATRGYIYSILDFIDKFGASTTPVVDDMKSIAENADEGKRLYLLQEYGESYSIMEVAVEQMEALRADAIRLKDRALLWVYVIEYISVTGVFMLSGFLLWTLMVRRSLYREVTVTKLRETE
ncbi:MAG: hypothetical protein HXS50_03170 [Theionarchaea archaeon]|nr:hypothetical protein [Theionarchaea archaeon]